MGIYHTFNGYGISGSNSQYQMLALRKDKYV